MKVRQAYFFLRLPTLPLCASGLKQPFQVPAHGGCACRVRGYPTIKSVVGGKTQDYNGERSASALKNWGLSLIPNKVVTVTKPAQVSDFLRRCSDSSKSGKNAAAWGLCVLLLTAKTETAPLYKSLSGQYAGKVAFGEARVANKELAERFKMDK